MCAAQMGNHYRLTEGEVLFASFGEENQLSSYLVNYNNAVCYNARNCGEEIYTGRFIMIGEIMQMPCLSSQYLWKRGNAGI